MKSAEIRKRFVNFYTTEGYRALPRAPMVDASIPMSFVMSAGLVQVEQSLARAQIRDSNKFVLVQDCFRHFDLDKVGTDDTHLSIFEMPGAFKFGPNGKMSTVQRMWELATLVLGMDKKRLWASYFRGGDVLENEIPEDSIVRQAWLDVGLPLERVVGLGVKDNYWLQGKGFNGGDVIRKSGPNTELFFDRGIDRGCGPHCQPGCKCGRFIEFSNSLFIRYEVDPENGQFKQLDDPFSETVIGTERVAMILQGGDSVFDIKSYRLILDIIHGFVQEDDVDASVLLKNERVIADHLKALYLLVADGAPSPGKNGRARIIKLLIRGIITRQILLKITSKDFIPAVVALISTVVNRQGNHIAIEESILEYFSSQRQQFMETIERGQRELAKQLSKNKGNTLSGKQILFLEKRVGYSPLLVEKALQEKSLLFHKEDYKISLEAWKHNML